MKKWISKSVMAVAMLAASGAAMAADGGQFFANGEVAGSTVRITNLQDSSNGMAGAVRLGYLWNNDAMSWGVETGFADLGRLAGNSVLTVGGAKNSARVKSRTRGELLGGNFKWHYGSGWFVSARGGWFHSRTSFRVNGKISNLSESSSTNGNGFYAGIGWGYDFNQHIGVSFNYDYYQAQAKGVYAGDRFKTGLYGGTFEYRF